MRFPNLKPSTTCNFAAPAGDLLERIKIAANKRDMPYQSLIKAWLAEKVDAIIAADPAVCYRRQRLQPDPRDLVDLYERGAEFRVAIVADARFEGGEDLPGSGRRRRG